MSNSTAQIQWRMEEYPLGEGRYRVYWVSAKGLTIVVADALGFGEARLITAAPKLLKALQTMVADFADYPASERPCHAFDLARAAIAEAGAA